MRLRWPVFLFSLGALFTANASDSQSQYEQQAAPNSLFEQRFIGSECADRTPGKKREPGARFVASLGTQAPYKRTRPETLTLSRADVPALTISADPSNWVEVTGSKRGDWSLRFCSQGEGNSEGEARERLEAISMSQVGSAVSLNGPAGFGHQTGTRGQLNVDAPADAPIVVHASFAPVEVRDMAGPVRVTAMHGRARILDTTGKVDASGFVVDFAGSKGTVVLSAEAEINLKLSTTRFEGTLTAWAQRPVRVLVPQASQTPFQAVVNRRQDFVCRTDFCSKVKQEKKDGLYVFTYVGDGSTPPGQMHLRSEQATVVIDTASAGTIP
jgi:hypothetical protein